MPTHSHQPNCPVAITIFTLFSLIYPTLAVTGMEDVLYQAPSITKVPLPAGYASSQQQNPVLYDLKITPEYSSNFEDDPAHPIILNCFSIARYYFSKVIKVERIEPQTQTKFVVPAGDYSNLYEVRNLFINYGFDTILTDMVVFMKITTDKDYEDPVYSGVSLVERRPLYGFMIFQSTSYLKFSPFEISGAISNTLHGLFHILGFNKAYFMPNP